MKFSAETTATLPALLLFFAATTCIGEANAQLLSERFYASDYNGEVVTNTLYYGAEYIGSTIWLKRWNNVRAHYFATGQVYQRYSALNEKIILACEGAFTEDSGRPDGLTIDNGSVVNRSLSSRMDGLVIVYATGGIVVSDIAMDMLKLNDGQYKLDILKSDDKTFFIDWAQRNSATVFQTQLLASSRGLRLDVSKAQRENRERRFLAIIRNGNQVTHVLIDVPRPFYLGPLTKLVYDYFQARAEVVGLLNLDTGDYNILQVNGSNGQPLNYPAGRVALSKATNLLVYYYAQ